MARFYFHLWNGSKFEIDETGVELAFAEQAYLEARQAALELWSEMERSQTDVSGFIFLVLDQHGHTMFDVPFAEVLAPRAKTHPKPSAEQSRGRHRALVGDLAHEIEQARDNIARSREIMTLSRSNRLHH